VEEVIVKRKGYATNWVSLFAFALCAGLSVVGDLKAEGAGPESAAAIGTQFQHGEVTREKMIEIAEAYVNYEWQPTRANISPRGIGYFRFHVLLCELREACPIFNYLAALLGVKYVDTPDRDTHTDWPEDRGWKANEVNVGVPYMWGGFSSLAGLDLVNPIDFEDQYTGTDTFEGEIHFAGDVNSDPWVTSRRACGVDCSGFVSRCWNLAFHVSSRNFDQPQISLPVTFDELQVGDILRLDGHVMLFKEFADVAKTQVTVYEAGGGKSKVIKSTYDIVEVLGDGHFVDLGEYGVYELHTYNAGQLE
jgi:hypothetical protein